MTETRPERRVLVVDDDKGVRTVVAWQLEAEGFTVLQAADGQQALDALATGRPDLLSLDQGADDYLVKPFSPAELDARVRWVLRRVHPAESAPLTAGPLRVDPATREVTLADRPVPLTAKEFDLLAFLAVHPRRVFSRAQLLAQVWQSSSTWQAEATVTGHVHRLRQKLEADPARPTPLRTCRGVGYQLDPSPAPARPELEATS